VTDQGVQEDDFPTLERPAKATCGAGRRATRPRRGRTEEPAEVVIGDPVPFLSFFREEETASPTRPPGPSRPSGATPSRLFQQKEGRSPRPVRVGDLPHLLRVQFVDQDLEVYPPAARIPRCSEGPPVHATATTVRSLPRTCHAPSGESPVRRGTGRRKPTRREEVPVSLKPPPRGERDAHRHRGP